MNTDATRPHEVQVSTAPSLRSSTLLAQLFIFLAGSTLLHGCGKTPACKISDVYAAVELNGKKGLGEDELQKHGVRICARHLSHPETYQGEDACSQWDKVFSDGELPEYGRGDLNAILLVKCPSVLYPAEANMQRVTCAYDVFAEFEDESRGRTLALFFDNHRDALNCQTEVSDEHIIQADASRGLIFDEDALRADDGILAHHRSLADSNDGSSVFDEDALGADDDDSSSEIGMPAESELGGDDLGGLMAMRVRPSGEVDLDTSTAPPQLLRQERRHGAGSNSTSKGHGTKSKGHRTKPKGKRRHPLTSPRRKAGKI